MADFMGLMKQAAQCSQDAGLAGRLDLIEVEGSAGGGMVSVSSPPGRSQGASTTPVEAIGKEILEDLLVAAHDARHKAEAVMGQDGLTGVPAGG